MIAHFDGTNLLIGANSFRTPDDPHLVVDPNSELGLAIMSERPHILVLSLIEDERAAIYRLYVDGSLSEDVYNHDPGIYLKACKVPHQMVGIPWEVMFKLPPTIQEFEDMLENEEPPGETP